MITYPRTNGRNIETTSANTAPEVGRNIVGLPAVVGVMLLYPTRDCSAPEPGAVRSDKPIEWRPKPPPFIPEGWTDPDKSIKPSVPECMKPTCSFASPPIPVLLPLGVKVYRVIGKSPDGRLVESVRGSWWTLERPPETEAEWRAKYAVCGHWNGDGGYIEYALRKEVRAWQGIVAPHRSVADGYILPGGAIQIWVPPGTIDPIRDGARLEDILRPTPWRERELREKGLVS